MPSAQIRYPNAVFGFNANHPNDTSDQILAVVASATVTQYQAVILDTANLRQVKPAATNSSGSLVVGIAAEGGAPADVILVNVGGFATASSNTAITAGDRLGLDATTAANLATITAATAVTQVKDTGNVIAIAAETVTAGVTSVRVLIEHV